MAELYRSESHMDLATNYSNGSRDTSIATNHIFNHLSNSVCTDIK